MNPNFDKEELRSYLLGTLEADRRMALEERILCEPDVYEELLIVEEDLIDQYVAGGLSKTEQQQFETHFLITAERQKNLRFGKLLKRYMDSQPVPVSCENVPVAAGQTRQPAPAPARKSLSSYLSAFQRRPALAFTALIIVCAGIGFLSWLAAKRTSGLTDQGNSHAVVVVSLTPGLERSSGTIQRVTVPPRGVNVKLELELSNPSFRKYKSQLFREDEELQTKDELKMEAKGDQHIVPLTIPGEILSPGDYRVQLSGVLDSGEDEFIDNYSFRVITE